MHPADRRRRAMTLTELLLALMVTAMVALAVLNLAPAMSGAEQRTREQSAGLQAAQISITALERVFRDARLVTAVSSREAVLWARDDQDPGVINVDEVLLLQYDPASGTVTRTEVVFPPGQQQANVPVELSQLVSYASALAAIGNESRRQSRAVAAEVCSWSLVAVPGVPQARSVCLNVSFNGGEPLLFQKHIALRARAELDLVNGQYVLPDNPG